MYPCQLYLHVYIYLNVWSVSIHSQESQLCSLIVAITTIREILSQHQYVMHIFN